MRRPAAAALLLLAVAAVARAEGTDVPALFESARAAHGQGQYGKALSDLKALATEVARLRFEQLAATLPLAPEGWTADDLGEPDAAAVVAVFATGLGVERTYRSGDDRRVQVSLMADSPVVAPMAMLLSNPQFLPPNSSVVTVKGRKALLETDADDRRAKLTFLLGANTSMLTVEGTRVEPAVVSETFASALDLDAIEKALHS